MQGGDPERGITQASESISSSSPRGYGTLSTAEKALSLKEGIAGSYDIDKLVTLWVFGSYDNTILKSATLWKETAMTAALYWSVWIILFFSRDEGFRKIVGSESQVRAFITMFMTLICFLIAFYTSLNLNRWWQMRQGVQDIQEASKKLALLISQSVTQDHELISTVTRYARASLYMIFAASECEVSGEHPLELVVARGLLDQEEADKLANCCAHRTFSQAETLWAWIANVITRLQEQGLVKGGGPHYCALLAAVELGRSGVSGIQCYLETPIPMGYVHLLCLMVKLHNLLITVLYAMMSVMYSGGEKGFQTVPVLRTAFRAFFMPFLFNALLILNKDVTDPFGSDASDFSFEGIDINMATCARAFSKSSDNFPECLKRTDYKAIDNGM